jgi:hypothetical protein
VQSKSQDRNIVNTYLWRIYCSLLATWSSNNHYWWYLLGCPHCSLLLHFCSQVGMGSRQLDRICLSARDIFPQGQCVTLSGESSQSGQDPGWHFRLQRWFPQSSFFSHIPSQMKYFEAEDSWVHRTSRVTFPQWHSAEEYHTISTVLRFHHKIRLFELYSFTLMLQNEK